MPNIPDPFGWEQRKRRIRTIIVVMVLAFLYSMCSMLRSLDTQNLPDWRDKEVIERNAQ